MTRVAEAGSAATAETAAGTSAGAVAGAAGVGGTSNAASAGRAGTQQPPNPQPSAGTSAAGSLAAGSGAAGMAGAAGSANAGTGAIAGAGAAGARAESPNPTIYIAGDSTVQTYTSGELEGWGHELGRFFDARVEIVNKAIGGRSVAYFMYQVESDASGTYQCSDSEGRPKYRLDANGKRIDSWQWSQIKKGMKSGDFLLVQFGHNDETHTCPRYVSTADFEIELGNMADTARAQGATPIFVTPMGHRAFNGTSVRNTLLPHANAMRHAAEQKSVEVADLNLRSVEYYAMVGDAYLAANIFDRGSTHFQKQGAITMAELIEGELRKNASPLAASFEVATPLALRILARCFTRWLALL
jgi:lysophospholipase L1-like esterase